MIYIRLNECLPWFGVINLSVIVDIINGYLRKEQMVVEIVCGDFITSCVSVISLFLVLFHLSATYRYQCMKFCFGSAVFRCV